MFKISILENENKEIWIIYLFIKKDKTFWCIYLLIVFGDSKNDKKNI